MTKALTLPKFSLLTAVTILMLLLPQAVDARGFKRARTEAVNKVEVAHPLAAKVAEKKAELEPVEEPSENAEEETVSCQYVKPDNPTFNAEVLTVRKKGISAPGELFEIEVYMKNTGNMPWFSANSNCPFLNVSLGTDHPRDRNSIFYTKDLLWESNWLAPNRIAMATKRVNPGEMAIFKFWSRAPELDGIYREYFAPVVEGVTWMDGGLFKTDISVGDPDTSKMNNNYIAYITESVELTRTDLSGERIIVVDISSQIMTLKIGDYVIRQQPMSTGKVSTPTPFGTTYIFQKQELRVGYAPPHYIMPKWLHFRRGGYGIHALPSLANDNGYFWTEALNHIGERRSHGCIRLLPEDADFTYDFAIIGTRVDVVP